MQTHERYLHIHVLNLITILWMNTWSKAYHVVEKYNISQIKLSKRNCIEPQCRNCRKNSVKLPFFTKEIKPKLIWRKNCLVENFTFFHVVLRRPFFRETNLFSFTKTFHAVLFYFTYSSQFLPEYFQLISRIFVSF